MNLGAMVRFLSFAEWSAPHFVFIWVTNAVRVCFHKQITGATRAANDGLDFVVGKAGKNAIIQ